MTQPAPIRRALTTAVPSFPALTVKQPWADALVHGTKRVENRTWSTRYRGLVAIHAGATYDRRARHPATSDYDAISAWWTALDTWPDFRGAVIAVARLDDIHPAADCCAPWGEPGTRIHHWQFTNVTALESPVKCPGARRLWALPLPVFADVVSALRRAAA